MSTNDTNNEDKSGDTQAVIAMSCGHHDMYIYIYILIAVFMRLLSVFVFVFAL